MLTYTFAEPHTHANKSDSTLFAETYHMIDKCDDEIACWSELGDNFVVKNVDKFASVSSISCKSILLYCDFYSYSHLQFVQSRVCCLCTLNIVTFQGKCSCSGYFLTVRSSASLHNRLTALFVRISETQLFQFCAATQLLRISETEEREHSDHRGGPTDGVLCPILPRKVPARQA